MPDWLRNTQKDFIRMKNVSKGYIGSGFPTLSSPFMWVSSSPIASALNLASNSAFYRN